MPHKRGRGNPSLCWANMLLTSSRFSWLAELTSPAMSTAVIYAGSVRIPVYVNPEVDAVSLGMREHEAHGTSFFPPIMEFAVIYVQLCGWLMKQGCCVWQMKPMGLIFILEEACRFRQWQLVQIWHLYPCIKAVEA